MYKEPCWNWLLQSRTRRPRPVLATSSFDRLTSQDLRVRSLRPGIAACLELAKGVKVPRGWAHSFQDCNFENWPWLPPALAHRVALHGLPYDRINICGVVCLRIDWEKPFIVER